MAPRRAILGLGLCAAAALFAPATASAQFYLNTSNPFTGYPFANPYFNGYRYSQRSFTFDTPYGGTVTANRTFVGSNGQYNRLTNRYPYGYHSPYGPLAGARNVGAAAPPPFPKPAFDQAAIGRMNAARNDADARKQIADQVAFEKGGAAGRKDPGLKGPLAAPVPAGEASEEEIVAGTALNAWLAADIALERRGGRAAGATLPPELLDKVAFGGSPAGDAANLLRADGLAFPVPLDADRLRGVRDDLTRRLADVAALVGGAKPVDPLKLDLLEEAAAQARERVAPELRDLPFDEAVTARRFLNDLEGAAAVLRDPAMAGMVDPRWRAEGTTVPDLVRQMAKYKLAFGPAAPNAAEEYEALYRGLAAYGTALNAQVKK